MEHYSQTKRYLYLALTLFVLLDLRTIHASDITGDNPYLTLGYHSTLDISLFGLDPVHPFRTHVLFFPVRERVGSSHFELTQMLYTGVFHSYENEDGLLWINRISTNSSDIRRYFEAWLATNSAIQDNTAVPPLVEMSHEEVEIWYRDTDTDEEKVVRNRGMLANMISVPLSEEMLEKLWLGRGELYYKALRRAQDRTQVFATIFQKTSITLDRLLKYHIRPNKKSDMEEDRFAELLADYQQKTKEQLSSIISIDEDCWEDPNCYDDLVEPLLETLSYDRILDHRYSAFVDINDILNMAPHRDWASCVRLDPNDPNNRLWQITDPDTFVNIATSELSNVKHYQQKDVGFGSSSSFYVPVQGWPMPVTGTVRYTDSQRSDYDEFNAWDGVKGTEGKRFQHVEIHYIDSRYLETEVSFSDLREIVKRPVDFYIQLPIVFTGSEKSMIPYSASPYRYTGSKIWKPAYTLFKEGRQQTLQLGPGDTHLDKRDIITSCSIETTSISGLLGDPLWKGTDYTIPSIYQNLYLGHDKLTINPENIIEITYEINMNNDYWVPSGPNVDSLTISLNINTNAYICLGPTSQEK